MQQLPAGLIDSNDLLSEALKMSGNRLATTPRPMVGPETASNSECSNGDSAPYYLLMVLFRSEKQRLVQAGEIKVTYRAWQSPRVRVGERYRVGAGSIQVDSCDPTPAAQISDEDATEAGFGSREGLIKAAAYRRAEGLAYPDTLYRVAFTYDQIEARPGPERERLTDEDAATLTKKLNAMDKRSSEGPWTWATLREIADNPGLVSSTLAGNLNRERFALKADIRKLKARGLTISLGTGYELSPRGQALLDRHDCSITNGSSAGRG